VYGIRKDVLEKENEVLDTVFFSSERKYSATLRKNKTGEKIIYVIGAPEKIFDMVEYIQTGDALVSKESQEYQYILNKVTELSQKGFRLVACAHQLIETEDATISDQITGLTLTGVIALNDPIRHDVPRAFKQTARAGIRTVIVTGDNKLTARAVAQKVGFSIEDQEIIEGDDIEKMNDVELREKTKTIKLYARVSPRHKLRIVQAFQHMGEIVAMFGDGVNDAPALKASNIGVAVNAQVDAAREVADIVLLDSGFKTIVKAIEQGRIIFNNIRRVFLYLITQDFSQFFVFFVSIAAGLPLPLVAAQLLFVNLVESGLPDLALTTEEDKHGIMKEAPRIKNASIVDKESIKWMMSAFAVSGGIALLFYYVVLHVTGDIALTRTMLTVLLCFESLFLSLSLRSFNKPIIRKSLFDNKWLTGAVIVSALMIFIALYVNPFQSMISLVPLSLGAWCVILLTNCIEILCIDKIKLKFLAK
jgi:Ca2+-transporting ATPase